ncbi:MAG: alpha-galactosidase [Verrucomicrobiae bacterium]|nr:alpha-galactosidase [Verrucomicrobiae bacterium]
MTRIAFLGAGSVVFARNILADILWHEALAGSEVRLMDIDPERLETGQALAESLNASLRTRARILATRSLPRALDGADFVISAIGVGGFPATRDDLLIPLRSGLKQTIGDTLGMGGIFRAARSIPVLLGICREMKRRCPKAWLLNYSNPMAMHCLAVERTTEIRHVGLCHGVSNTARFIRACLEIAKLPPSVVWNHFLGSASRRAREWAEWMSWGDDPALNFTCAGINHMAFFLRFESGGRDLYPALRRLLALPWIRRLDPVRLALFERLGWYMTETSDHMAEYVPWFLKDPEEIRRHHLRVAGYLDTCRAQEKRYRALRRDLRRGKPAISIPYRPSNEYASRILNAIVTGRPYVFNGNIHNRGGALIANLPGDCCVETPCIADRSGIRPTFVGKLPPQCAALIRTNVNVQDLAVRGILARDRRLILQAAMLDPNTASQLSADRIASVCDALFRAHAKRLPSYRG